MSIDRLGLEELDGSGATEGQVPGWSKTGGGLFVPINVLHSVVAGSNVSVDNTDPLNPVISATGGGGGGSLTVQDENGTVATGVTQIDFQGAGVTAAAGTGEVVVTIPGGSGTAPRDRRWLPGATQTTIDEFNDDTLDAAWVRVDASGGSARATWTESGDVLSVLNAGGDASAERHALLRPVGAAMTVGDAFVTCVTIASKPGTLAMGCLVVADGTTYGSGTQVEAFADRDTNGFYTDVRVATGFNTTGTVADGLSGNVAHVPYHLRLVKLASNAWRRDWSLDGISWIKGAATITSTIVPTHVGVVSSSWGNAQPCVASYDYLRRVAGIS